jgi:hypothetical protein
VSAEQSADPLRHFDDATRRIEAPCRLCGLVIVFYEGSMSETKAYEGGCQCGNVRYEVKLDLDKGVMACNCSMCGRAGTLLSFVPASDFELKSGDDSLKDYQFNKHVIHHVFCTTCGIKSFARGEKAGQPMIAVNARCLDGVDVGKLKVTHFDGRSM